MTYQVDVTTMPARTLAAFRFHVTADEMDRMGQMMGAAFGRVMAALRAADTVAAGPPVARYRCAVDGFDVDAGFPIRASAGEFEDGVVRTELPAVEVAHTTHVGPYRDLPEAYDALRAEARARGRELDDDANMWEEYLTGPDVPAARTRTEVYWPLAT